MSANYHNRKPYNPSKDHFDAGLEYLHSTAAPGQVFSQYEIAEACGVSRQAIQIRERNIYAKIREQFGIELEEYL